MESGRWVELSAPLTQGMAKIGPTTLVDSVIIIDHFNGVAEATEYLSSMHGRVAVSVITRTEVLTGFEGKNLRLAKRLLDRFPTLIIDRTIADLAATLRRQHRWKTPDALQAALAKRHKLKLATRDTDDFPPGQHRFVRIPYTLN
jgi:predicted nucleic acid-binding protein